MHSLSVRIILCCLLMAAGTQPLRAQSSLTEDLTSDVALQETTLIAIRSALGGRDNTAVVRRGGFLPDLRIYIETYRAMRDENTLANIQTRYSAAKAELLEPRLPATIEELVSLLETLY